MCSQEAANNMPAEEAEVIKLYCQIPPIQRMDGSLNSLRNCVYVRRAAVCSPANPSLGTDGR